MFENLERFLHPERVPTTTKEVMTFREWFLGRFWAEWVVGRKNKATEVRTKTGVYEGHLEPWFGDMRLDEITVSECRSFARRSSQIRR